MNVREKRRSTRSTTINNEGRGWFGRRPQAVAQGDLPMRRYKLTMIRGHSREIVGEDNDGR